MSNRSVKTGEGQQNKQDQYWWHFSRRIHNEAYKALSTTFDLQINEDEEVFLTKNLSRQYNALFLEIGSEEFENSSTFQKLETKLKQMYGDKISIEKEGQSDGRLHSTVKCALKMHFGRKTILKEG